MTNSTAAAAPRRHGSSSITTRTTTTRRRTRRLVVLAGALFLCRDSTAKAEAFSPLIASRQSPSRQPRHRRNMLSTSAPRPHHPSLIVPRGGGGSLGGASSLSASASTPSGGGQQQSGGGGSANNNNNSDERLSTEGAVCMALLALQFGIQPALVKAYTPGGIVKSSVVLVQELTKFVISCGLYFGGTEKEQRKIDFAGMSVWSWIAIAMIPAALYNVQNIASLLAYQNLEPLTFNVLNQTKTLSAAVCCFLVMGQRQSKMQMVSLCLLLVSALVIENVLTVSSLMAPMAMLGGIKTLFSSTGAGMARHVTHGVFPILLASFISGLAGAVVQKNLQGVSKSGKKKKVPRNPYLFNMELNSASALLLILSMLFTADGTRIATEGFFAGGWTLKTLIPILTNSIGGIIVALVTKYAGSVRKGFALIFGILISGVIQAAVPGGEAGIKGAQVMGGALAACSLYLHTSYPYKPKVAATKAE